MRNFLSQHKRLIIINFTLFVLFLALLGTNRFLQEFKQEERNKIEIMALAYQKLNDAAEENEDITLPTNILNSNHTIPIIIIDQDDHIYTYRNLKTTDTIALFNKAMEFELINKPIHFELDNNKYHDLYYGNSSLLNKLKYYPLVLVFIFLLFVGIIYQYYHTGKVSDENRLWSGLAKETAHQIGTPLSSLMGWVEILKEQKKLDIPIEEIEKDIQRLNVISQRFSKIGSTPKLKEQNISEITKKTIGYLRSRTSKLVDFEIVADDNIPALLNRQLYSWVIENLVKNAVDAMGGKGKITIHIHQNNKNVFVDISDTGKGILSTHFKDIFQPGFTTKKRGWGLGLSLAKRIIEQYHNGKIYIKESITNKGTTFRIEVQKENS